MSESYYPYFIQESAHVKISIIVVAKWYIQPHSMVISYSFVCWAYSSTLKMDAICATEMLVNIYWTAGNHIPDGSTFDIHLCGNLTSHRSYQAVVSLMRFHLPYHHHHHHWQNSPFRAYLRIIFCGNATHEICLTWSSII
jgi:hypothetical protein